MSCYFGYVEGVEDALQLIEAAQASRIPMLKRRLTSEQRASIKSGSTFLFEESASGIKRWTDGLTWSPSRFSEGFFLYRQIPKATESYSARMPTLRKKVISIGIKATGRRIHIVNYYTDRDIVSGALLTPTQSHKSIRHTSLAQTYELPTHYIPVKSKRSPPFLGNNSPPTIATPPRQFEPVSNVSSSSSSHILLPSLPSIPPSNASSSPTTTTAIANNPSFLNQVFIQNRVSEDIRQLDAFSRSFML